MTALATEIRTDLIDAIDVVGVPVISPAPEVPIPPCVAITWGTPWIQPSSVNRGGWDIQARLMCVTRYSDDNLPQLEQLVQDVIAAIPGGWTVDTVTAPAQLDTGAQGVVLVSEVQINATYPAPTP